MALSSVTHVHFIGIGGVGMSGIALVAHDQGISVSGSDLRESGYTAELREAGIPVSIGQKAGNIPEGDVAVVVSTAINEDNPELSEARRRGLPVWHRAQMLAYLGRGLKTLAVTGTHGKTTTSSMLASVLEGLGEDPTFLIGGIVRAYDTNAHSGSGEYYVIEADESDKSFTHLSPFAVLATNIEADHLDHYRDLDEIYEKFADFFALVPPEGVVVACGDDAPLARLAKASGRRCVTYGFGRECDVRVEGYEAEGVASRFSVVMPDGTHAKAEIRHNPGAHNVVNAAGVLALVWALGLPVGDAAAHVAGFEGVHRRFELVGREAGVTVVDDYAHHPTEIAATVGAAAALGFGRVRVLFQPHRYSRAKLFCEVLRDEFGSAFDAADEVVFTDVFPAGEEPIPGVTGQTFLDTVLAHEGHPLARYVAGMPDAVADVAGTAREGDLVITMGAGDVTAAGPLILDALRRR